MASTHNLDINTYSLEEIFGLFDLNYNLTEQTMRAAKMKVLMIHPDKSRLPATYFHFYKQAYEIVLNIYKQKTKTGEPASTVYSPNVVQQSSIGNNQNPENTQDYSKQVSNSKFNELYDKNMVRNKVSCIIAAPRMSRNRKAIPRPQPADTVDSPSAAMYNMASPTTPEVGRAPKPILTRRTTVTTTNVRM